VFSSLAAAGVTFALAAPVSAHINADPSEAQAGSTQTIGFTIEHGCDGSPTIAVDMLIPAGVTDVEPQPLDGWTATLDTTDDDEELVRFEGGSLADGTEGTFEATLTLPPTPDTVVFFPIVQRCEVGELRWIEIPIDGEEPDYPAPSIQLIGPAVTTTAPATSNPATTPDTAVAASTVAAAEPGTATTVAAGDTVPASAPSTTVADDDDGSTNTGTIVFIVSIIAVLIVAAIAYTVARRNRRGDGDAPADADR